MCIKRFCYATARAASSFLLVFVAFFGGANAATPASGGSGIPAIGVSLMQKAMSGGPVRVIALFKPGSATNLAGAQADVLDRIAQTYSIAPNSVKKFRIVPGMALQVDAAGLQALMNDPVVASVVEDVPRAPTLLQSIPLIHADRAWALGYRGQGQTVAILDTGVDKVHPFLTGKVVSEACYSSNGAGSGYTYSSLCPGGVTASTATGSGVNCSTAISGCSHGTHVAGIAAGKNGTVTGGTINGVAPDATIIAIKVFTRFDGAAACGSSAPCVLAFDSDMIQGLERVYTLRTAFQISSANLSIGGGQYFTTCDTNPLKPIIDTLRNAAIATAIASGNNGFSNSTGAPGCISTAITVGSSDKSDIISSFSNNASWVDLIAPGSSICSSVTGSQTANCSSGGYGYMSGTSMATPHVTGAWALMKSKNGTASVNAIENALKTTGILITTPAGNKPRISMDVALGALTSGPQLGLNWDHCQQTWRALGDNKTWCYLESNTTWIWTNDSIVQNMMLDAAASDHWFGINVNSFSGGSFTFNYAILWKY